MCSFSTCFVVPVLPFVPSLFDSAAHHSRGAALNLLMRARSLLSCPPPQAYPTLTFHSQSSFDFCCHFTSHRSLTDSTPLLDSSEILIAGPSGLEEHFHHIHSFCNIASITLILPSIKKGSKSQPHRQAATIRLDTHIKRPDEITFNGLDPHLCQ